MIIGLAKFIDSVLAPFSSALKTTLVTRISTDIM